MKNLIALLLLLGAIGAAYVYGLSAWDNVTALRARIAEVDMVAEKIEDIKGKRDEIISRYNSTNAQDIERLKKLFPERIDEEEMYVLFEQAAIQSQMAPTKILIKPAGASVETGRGSLAFDITVEGPYDNIRGFLSLLENNIRLMDITAIKVGDVKGSVFTINVTGSLYYGG